MFPISVQNGFWSECVGECKDYCKTACWSWLSPAFDHEVWWILTLWHHIQGGWKTSFIPINLSIWNEWMNESFRLSFVWRPESKPEHPAFTHSLNQESPGVNRRHVLRGLNSYDKWQWKVALESFLQSGQRTANKSVMSLKFYMTWAPPPGGTEVRTPEA